MKGSGELRSLGEIVPLEEERFLTGIGEFDRVLGGGAVPGSTILVGGDPGIGKSTLLLQAALLLASRNYKVLYVTGEESLQQVKMRAERLNLTQHSLLVLAETEYSVIERQIIQNMPQVVILDSIQTVMKSELGTVPGSVIQIREVTASLIQLAKNRQITFFIVGHVTKEGAIAGPRMLEHMVDCVLYFEGERYQNFRILRGVKNRFGSTNEIGIFTMERGAWLRWRTLLLLFEQRPINTPVPLSYLPGRDPSPAGRDPGPCYSFLLRCKPPSRFYRARLQQSCAYYCRPGKKVGPAAFQR